MAGRPYDPLYASREREEYRKRRKKRGRKKPPPPPSKRVPTISKEKYGPPVPARTQLKYSTPQGNALFGLLDIPEPPKPPTKKQLKEEAEKRPGLLDVLSGGLTEARAFPGAMLEAITKTGKAGGKDIANLLPGADPFPLYSTHRDPRTGKLVRSRESYLYSGVGRAAPAVIKATARTVADIGIVAAGDPVTVRALKKIDKDAGERLEKEARAAEWRIAHAPISTAATFAYGGGLVSKGFTIPRLVRQMKDENPGLTTKEAVRHAERELRNPGAARAAGIKGGIPSRVISSEAGDAVGRPWSRTPGGRMGQNLYDAITEGIDSINPNYPFSSSGRVSRVQQRRQAQIVRGNLAALDPLVDQMGDVLTGTTGRKPSRAKLRGVMGISRPIRERAEAMIAALEGPENATVREAAEARVGSLEDMLARSAGLEHLVKDAKVLRQKIRDAETPEQQAALGKELGLLASQIDMGTGRISQKQAVVSGSPERKKAVRVWTELFGKRQAQALGMAADLYARNLSPDDPAAWYRQNLADVTSGKAQDFVDSAQANAAQFQRAGRRRGLTTPRHGSGKLDERAALTMLNRQPPMPGQGGMVMFTQPRGGSANLGKLMVMENSGTGQFSVREIEIAADGHATWGQATQHTNREARRILREADASAFNAHGNLMELHGSLTNPPDADVPVFYSELQVQVDKLFSGETQRMKAQSLKAQLRENVSQAEWDAMGMEAFFRRYHPTDRVPEKDLQDFLSDPLNAYNWDEVLYSSDASRDFGDRWGSTYGWRLNFRQPKKAIGETYYELVMTLGARQPGAFKDFRTMHWDLENPVVHIRFTVITDTSGKRAIVIDEIQSDWHTKAREQAAEQEQYGPLASVAEIETRVSELIGEQEFLRRNNPRLTNLRQIEENWKYALTDEEMSRGALNRALSEEENATYVSDTLTQKIALLRKSHEDSVRHKANARARLDAIEQELGPDVIAESKRLRDELRTQQTKMYKARDAVDRPEWKLRDTEVDAAVRRMMRFAHDENIDRIILVPAEMQVFRNMAIREAPSGKRLPDPELGEDQLDAWIKGAQEFQGMDADAMRAFARARLGTEESRAFKHLYEEKYPALFEKHIGHKGRFIDGIFTGKYTDEANTFTSDEAPMRGWVIDMGEEGRRRASIPMRQMQRQPDWDGLPRGATELLADGRRAMRLFEGADVDTVIHELAHIALPDIDVESRAIIERHFGGNIDDWTEQNHEAYARAFESYFRSGRAANVQLASAFSAIAKWMRGVWKKLYGEKAPGFDLHPEVGAAFDRMLGYRGVPTILSKTERSQVRSQIKSLTKALEGDDIDSPEFAQAVDTLEVLADQIEEAGVEILTRNAPPELHQAIREGLDNRRNLVTNRMAEQGVIDWTPETEARGYFPQTSIWDIQGMPQAAPVRMAAVQDVVGTPRLEGKTVMRKPNRLIRYSTGEVLNDPAVLVRVLRSRLRFLETLTARNELWDAGKPIKKGEKIPDFSVALVRNPNVTPKKIGDDIYAALRLPPERYAELEMRGKMDDIDEAESLEDAASDFIWMPGMGAKPSWVSDTANVRSVPIEVARKRLGDVFVTAPRGRLGAVAGSANALARLSAIYLPYGGTRYVARNAAQNAVMLGLTQPRALARIGRAHSKYKRDNPEEYHRILAEGGTILGTALPEFNIRPTGRAQEAERYITERTGASGTFLGKFADNPFRWAAWTRHAERMGFHGVEGHRRLLNDPDLSEQRETVMQRTRDDMIDFDALTPFEKEFVSRYFFLWPFIRGITKWPFMYAREYPGRLAAISMLPKGEEDDLSTGAMRDRMMMGGRDFAWLDPSGPALENLERIERLARGKDTANLSAVADMMAPHWRELVQSLSDRQGQTYKKSLANTWVPFGSTVNAITRGGNVMAQLDRFLGQSTEPPMSVVRQRQGRAAEVNKYLDLLDEDGLELSEPNLQKLLTAHNAYERYKELSARVEFGLRDQGKEPTLAADSKNHRTRAAVMFAVADEFYPGSIPLTLEDYDRMTPEGRKEFFKQVEKGLWGMREEFLKQAKEKYGKDEEE